MQRALSTRLLPALATLAILLLPQPARGLDLFEGNLGYGGDWLFVLDAPAMGDRLYWYDLGEGFTYHVQCAGDEAFQALVLDEMGIAENYVEPALGPGFYFFRARELHASGAAGAWSDTGTLEVVEDVAAPEVEILSPRDGSYSAGDPIAVEIRVADDTVLHLARFTINGEYVGVLGLKTENYKVSPSFGEPRTVVFETEVPKGSSRSLELTVTVSDVTYKQTSRTVTLSGSSTSKGGKGKGRR